ncbi:MAG TPA: VWA domain-containing protein [Actinomycetes bacterium]|nr:VWA domain-containing protein [Actinomycetes bacterium]
MVQTRSDDSAVPRASNSACESTLQIVTARSFAPVLTTLAPSLAAKRDCVRLDVVVADGRAAIDRVAELGADVWIPDDSSWVALAGDAKLAPVPEPTESGEPGPPGEGGAGTVVAVSPMYMVADPAAAPDLDAAGGGWGNLAHLLSTDSGVRLRVRDPARSGDGLVGVGAIGESIWLSEGMDASAETLASALPSSQTVLGQAIPHSGEVGLIAEYALDRFLAEPDPKAGSAAATIKRDKIFAGSDYTAVLRYTWLPTAAALADSSLADPMARVLAALTSKEAEGALAAAGLRRADGSVPGDHADGLPEQTGTVLGILGPHHVEHVFATWYIDERRSNLLVVIDVSGSMGARAPGTQTPLIDVVRNATRELADLLPDDSELAIWKFGSNISPPRDYRTVLPQGRLDAQHRDQLIRATRQLRAENTGTGLYDTILAAYKTAQASFQEGTPSYVVLFTDGRNQDDPGSLTAAELTNALAQAADPKREVYLTIISFGPDPDAELLRKIVEPIEGYVDPVRTADEVRAVFIHVAAGGVHH